jgi:3-dehydroquinate synthase
VLVERGLLRSAADVLGEQIPLNANIFVISSETILRLWGDHLSQSFSSSGRNVIALPMPEGETAKRLSAVEKLASQMVASGADRRSVVLALGGGVVGDVAGFLASIFMRGIPVVQVPTTLVAQVDSAIGGKTGVNLSAGKNLIGTFHQPSAVLSDPDVLATLPEREYRSGLFEAMKYGVIRNAEIFDFMESQRDGLLRRDGELLERLIVDCVKVKADVVSADEREGGERRILNFGHTIGHALEAATKYKHFLHGEAVGWGMVAAAAVGREVGITDAATAARIRSLVMAYGPVPRVETSGQRVLRLIQADKKTIGGIPHFVLARSMGMVEVVSTVSKESVLNSVAEIRRLSKS